MKYVAKIDDSEFLMSMTRKELACLLGFSYEGSLKSIRRNNSVASDADEFSNLIGQEIKVTKIFEESTETLSAYKELQNKLVSVRNQLTFLTNKMVELNPVEKEGEDK